MISRVLIVNDSKIERSLAKKSIGESYFIFEANSGAEAYQILDKESVEIIFLDNLMDNETGYEIAKKLRKEDKYNNIPLILMSSDSSPLNEMEAFESGFNAYLKKSDIQSQILSLIRSFEQKNIEKTIKSLIVDDSKIIRNLLSFTFKKEGFIVKEAESGYQAIEILKKYEPDFITMDAEMDDINGYQAAKLIISNPNTKHIPIIMITNNDTAEARKKGIEAGITDYFIKPFEPIKLVEHIKSLL